MGEMNKIHCCRCGKDWEFRTGCGIMHSQLDRIAGLFIEDIAEQFMVYAEEKPPVIFDFAFKPAQCSNCRNIVDVPVLEVKGEHYVGDCLLCGHKVKTLKDTENLKCPICSGEDFEQSIIGHWD